MKTQEFTPDQFHKFCRLRPLKISRVFLGIFVFSLFAAFATGYLSYISNTLRLSDSSINLIAGLVLGVPAATLLFWLYKSIQFSKLKQRALYEVFDDLGWQTDTEPQIEKWPISPSSIVHNLSSNNPEQAPRYLRFLGDFDNYPAECVWLDARFFDINTSFIYMHIGLRYSYPHTIVDGKNGMLRNDLPAHIGNAEEVSPEGNLHKYFKVYTLKEQGQAALYTLTTNVLEKIYDYGTNFNIEIIGNSLYIFSRPNLLDDENGFTNFMNLSLYLSRTLSKSRLNNHESSYKYNSDYSHTRMDITSHYRPEPIE